MRYQNCVLWSLDGVHERQLHRIGVGNELHEAMEPGILFSYDDGTQNCMLFA